ncbi:MAG: hypothetical protein AAFO84_09310 [Cyanobacteria bacterium J06598_1]
MTQLTKTTQKSSSNRPSPAENSAVPGRTKLGYEVFNHRRLQYAQVPLSISNQQTPSASTGSALLDSFLERSSEAAALGGLNLINVSARDALPSSELAASQSARTERQPIQNQPAVVPVEPDVATAKAPALVPDVLPSVNPAVPVKSAAPADLYDVESSPDVEALPPLEAEPDFLEVDSDTLKLTSKDEGSKSEALSSKPQPLPVRTSVPVPPSRSSITTLPTPPAKKTPAPQLAAQAALPKPPPKPPSLPLRKPSFSPVIDHEKMARDSAASVGLLDLSDALLFGGDREDLIAADPFVEIENPEEETGVLAYLSQQVSAFTVDKLQSGFPNNTDPRVLHRPDPPKHRTVLDIQSFKLADLLGSEQESNKLAAATTTQKSSAQEPTDIHTLSQQVEVLNRKIATLTEKLAEVSSNA